MKAVAGNVCTFIYRLASNSVSIYMEPVKFSILSTHPLEPLRWSININQEVNTHCATLTATGTQARARPISSTPRKKKLELDARNGRVAGRQLLTNDT